MFRELVLTPDLVEYSKERMRAPNCVIVSHTSDINKVGFASKEHVKEIVLNIVASILK